MNRDSRALVNRQIDKVEAVIIELERLKDIEVTAIAELSGGLVERGPTALSHAVDEIASIDEVIFDLNKALDRYAGV